VPGYFRPMTFFSDCHDSPCPILFAVELIGNKWSILILRELFSGSRRTSTLAAALPGISSKTLTLRLRELEQHGLVSRQVFPEIPPRVEYTLTARGQELQPLMDALYTVGRRWLDREVCHCPLTAVAPGQACDSSALA